MVVEFFLLVLFLFFSGKGFITGGKGLVSLYNIVFLVVNIKGNFKFRFRKCFVFFLFLKLCIRKSLYILKRVLLKIFKY